MKKVIRFESKNIVKLMIYGMILLLILSGVVMYHNIPRFSGWKIITLYVCMVVGFFIIVFSNFDLSINSVAMSAGIGIYLFWYICITQNNLHMFWVRMFFPFIFFAFFNNEIIRKKRLSWLLSSYSNIIICIAAISLFFWVFGTQLDLLPGRQMILYNWGKSEKSYTYFFIYFENPIQGTKVMGREIMRNTGICPEAPGYVSYLMYAFLIEAFYYRFKNKTKCTILILTILSTLSTKGFLFLIEAIVLIFFLKTTNKTTLQTLMKIAGGVFLLIGTVYIVYYLLQDKSSTGSFKIRLDDIHAELATWLEHPIFGAGYENIDEIVAKFRVVRFENGLSMGFSTLLATMGLYVTTLYILPFFLLISTMKHDQCRIDLLIAGIMIFTDLVFSTIQSAPHFIFIITLAYASAINYHSTSKSYLELIPFFQYASKKQRRKEGHAWQK